MTRRTESSEGENLIGRQVRDPFMGKQRGTISQHLSPRTLKKKIKKAPPARRISGIMLPPSNSEINQGEARRDPRTIMAETTF